MRHTFQLFLSEHRKKLQEDLRLTSSDFERISKMLSHRHVHLRSTSLRKMWDIFLGKRKLSRQTLNRLALFAGFQDWADLDNAIHGEVDASVNYREGRLQRAPQADNASKKQG